MHHVEVEAAHHLADEAAVAVAGDQDMRLHPGHLRQPGAGLLPEHRHHRQAFVPEGGDHGAGPPAGSRKAACSGASPSRVQRVVR